MWSFVLCALVLALLIGIFTFDYGNKERVNFLKKSGKVVFCLAVAGSVLVVLINILNNLQGF